VSSPGSLASSPSALRPPRLSFGLPVFNGERSIGRTIASIQKQTFADFELVISDNHSTDGTARIVQERSRHDPRVRFFPQPSNAGIVANFNRAFRLARGEYFRWIGADDWVEPEYAEKCVRLLDQHPEAIGVTTYQAHWSERGEKHYAEHQGRRVDSAQAHERFEVCLWLLNEDYRFFDPMYSMHRRRVLEHARGLRPILNGDQMLAAELSLLGPYVHVPECLANRGIPRANEARILEILRPPGHPPLNPHPEQYLRVFHELIQAAPLQPAQKLACYGAAILYYLDKFEWSRIRPLRALLGERLRELGVPMDRLSPFR
jgi:glycosyltransferase involved in cell wall biosynthesis